MGVGTEKGQLWDILSYDQKTQPRKPIKYFIMIKQIVCKRPLQVLAFLYF